MLDSDLSTHNIILVGGLRNRRGCRSRSIGVASVDCTVPSKEGRTLVANDRLADIFGMISSQTEYKAPVHYGNSVPSSFNIIKARRVGGSHENLC